ncbi:MAG: hypothetical protein ACTSO8_05525 [Promethearchaeota archaeon]
MAGFTKKPEVNRAVACSIFHRNILFVERKPCSGRTSLSFLEI